MSSPITNRQLEEKIELLQPSQKQRVYELVLSLLGQSAADSTARKHLLLETSVWSEQDIRPIEEAQQDVNAWRIPT